MPQTASGASNGANKATRRSPKGERTRGKILDVAERLFGQKSYDTVSQRDVADEAELLIGLVTHHYSNKVSLFDAVIARRAGELNQRRLQRLADTDPASVEAIIDAFFEPLLELIGSGDEGWINYARLMSKMVYSDVGAHASSLYYSETVGVFLDALSNAMPDCDRSTVNRAFICSIETILTSLYIPGRFGSLPGLEGSDSQDPAKLYSSIRPYVLGGISALRMQRR